MALNWPFRLLSSWPKGVPRLYPHLNEQQLSQFLDWTEFSRIAALPLVSIHPLASKDSGDQDVMLGLGLQKLLIRDLMLVGDLSVRGPEDSPEAFLEAVPELRERNERTIFVSGRAETGHGWWRVELQFFAPGQKTPLAATVHETDWTRFLMQLAATIAHVCRGTVTPETQKMWQFGRPSSPHSLLALGEICASYDRYNSGRSTSALRLYQRDPNLVVTLHQVEEEPVDIKKLYQQGLERDPYDAQLCFLLALAYWNSTGPQPEVVQFCRRAIELSPGHGKAHMCAPHAAAAGVNMILHSELGYRLLPNNPFAINNFILYLQEQNAPPQQIIRLAHEGIQVDPYDPGNYERLIEMCVTIGDYATALATAEELQTLFEPQINERALYCLQQNPRMAEMLRTGQFDPAAHNRQRIDELRRMAGSR